MGLGGRGLDWEMTEAKPSRERIINTNLTIIGTYGIG